MSYSNGPRIVTDGLVLCLDAGNSKSYPKTGTSFVDLSGYGNTAILQNSPTFSNDNYGNFSFNGTNNRISISPASSLIRNFNSTTVFTVKLPVWSGGQRCILSYRGAGGGGDMYIGKNSNGIFIFYNQLNIASYIEGNLSANSLAIIQITCDATNNILGLNINGSQIGSVSRTGWVSSYCVNPFYIGYDGGGTNEYMLGNFYQFRHYNKVLNGDEMKQNYNALKSRFNL